MTRPVLNSSWYNVVAASMLCVSCSSGSSTPKAGTSVEPGQSVDGTMQGFRLVEVVVDEGNDGSADEIYRLVHDNAGLSIGELIDGDGDGSFEDEFSYSYTSQLLATSSYDSGRDGSIDVVRTFVYDEESRLQALLIDATNPALNDSRIDYTLNDAGLVSSSMTDSNGDGETDSTTAYTYDNRQRVATVTEDDNADGNASSLSIYNYDELGRVVSRTTDVGLDGSIDSSWRFVYQAGLCDPANNHQPLNHGCVFPE